MIITPCHHKVGIQAVLASLELVGTAAYSQKAQKLHWGWERSLQKGPAFKGGEWKCWVVKCCCFRPINANGQCGNDGSKLCDMSRDISHFLVQFLTCLKALWQDRGRQTPPALMHSKRVLVILALPKYYLRDSFTCPNQKKMT